jgi:hypothetical protein
MDPEIEELKEMVAKNLAISEETNRLAHTLRRSAGWGTFFTVLYWLFIIGALGASYLYINPYITKFEQFYKTIQPGTSSSTESQPQGQQIWQAFQNFFPKSQ